MFASQSAGIAASSVIAGSLLMSGDVTTTALVLAALVAAGSVFVGIFRERPGERLMPWSKGTASPECLERQQGAFWPIITKVAQSLFNRHVLFFLAGMVFLQTPFAFADAVSPTLAVQHLGWSSEAYSNFGGALGLMSAGAALIVPVPLVLWLGLGKAAITQIAMLAIIAAAAGLTLPTWQGDTAFMIYGGAIYALSLTAMITIDHLGDADMQSGDRGDAVRSVHGERQSGPVDLCGEFRLCDRDGRLFCDLSVHERD